MDWIVLAWQNSVKNSVLKLWLISNLMHKILICLHIMHLLKSSTCFEHCSAHLQEVYVVIVYMQPVKKQLFLNRCTGHLPADSDNARGCIYTVTT